MKLTEIFDEHVDQYEEWYNKYPFVFQSEVEALREMLPVGDKLSGIEVGLGTGRFSQALGIKEGIEPSAKMRALAIKRGIEIMNGSAESLPYKDMKFDFVLMAFCISYFTDLSQAFKEAFRVLKNGGVLVVGSLDRNSTIGKMYLAKAPESTFYKNATFYSTEKILEKLMDAGFRKFEISQTLFGDIESIKEVQAARQGYGEGSFVVINAMKKV